MSTKFFTNEEENTLINKIEGIFKHRNIHFFDALIGYFRASGYFRIRKFIERAAEIRMLVGINIDNLINEASQQGLLFDPNAEKELIITAKEAIRKGRFQNLQRDINNKLKKAVGKSPLKPVIILERIITILKNYPLVNEEIDEVEQVKVIASKILNPETIITESFSK